MYNPCLDKVECTAQTNVTAILPEVFLLLEQNLKVKVSLQFSHLLKHTEANPVSARSGQRAGKTGSLTKEVPKLHEVT